MPRRPGGSFSRPPAQRLVGAARALKLRKVNVAPDRASLAKRFFWAKPDRPWPCRHAQQGPLLLRPGLKQAKSILHYKPLMHAASPLLYPQCARGIFLAFHIARWGLAQLTQADYGHHMAEKQTIVFVSRSIFLPSAPFHGARGSMQTGAWQRAGFVAE